MYRIVLCFRYLLSRWWLTVVAAGVVWLGVSTTLVVLAIMSGLATEMRQAIRGGLSDVIAESDIGGIPHYDELIERLKQHPNVAEATPVVQLVGLARIEANPLTTPFRGSLSRPVQIYGVRPRELARVNAFREFLNRQQSAETPSFELPENLQVILEAADRRIRPGTILGIELASYELPTSAQEASTPGARDSVILCPPGDTVVLTTLPVSEAGAIGRGAFGAVKPTSRGFTVVDFYKSGIYTFDSQVVYIPFDVAQELGELGDPTGFDPDDPPRTQQIRIALKDYGRAAETVHCNPADPNDPYTCDTPGLKVIWETFQTERPKLRHAFLSFATWEERKVDLLAAVDVERVLLLLVTGLIIAVAGFAIGAVLVMIAREKTRDIGIMKSLGASHGGVATIFLMYGGITSAIGAAIGVLIARLIIANLDAIVGWLGRSMGIVVFNPKIYGFESVPRHEDPVHITLVVVITIAWAVLCSGVAALRTAMLQPVEALRYE